MNKQSDVDYVYPKKGGSPDVPGALGDTEGWLIEDPSDHPLKYWSGGHRYGSAWTDNASKAVRFSRREDAEAVIKNTLDERWIACGHEWISTHAPDWKKRAVRAEADIEKLKMDAEHLQYERDEAREKLAARPVEAKAEAGELRDDVAAQIFYMDSEFCGGDWSTEPEDQKEYWRKKADKVLHLIHGRPAPADALREALLAKVELALYKEAWEARHSYGHKQGIASPQAKQLREAETRVRAFRDAALRGEGKS